MPVSTAPVSWLLPVRDGARWLRRSVDSALQQCLPQDEVVVIDDGSTDRPEQVLPPGQGRRLVLVSQPHRGIVAALEQGRAVARGAWLARLDADDVALPGRLAAQRQALAAEPRLAAIGGQATLIDAIGEGMARYVDWVNTQTLTPDDLQRNLLVESPLFHPAVTLRAEALAAVGGYQDGDFPEDYELWLRLVAAGWRLANLPQPVVRLQDHPHRLTRTDPRYRRAAFTRLKQEHLARTRLAHPGPPLAVWGAGRAGRPWIRWLQAQKHPRITVVDPFQSGSVRQGLPVQPPDDLPPDAFLLVAVGAREARQEIQRWLRLHQPHRQEGIDWLAVC